MNAIFNAEDFSHAGYIVDNREQETLTAKLTITPKQLELVKKATELSEIFTKIYDGDNTVDIIDDLGELLFGFSGIHSSDDGISDAVTVVSANYASEYVGQAIQVSFVLGGEDKENRARGVDHAHRRGESRTHRLDRASRRGFRRH